MIRPLLAALIASFALLATPALAQKVQTNPGADAIIEFSDSDPAMNEAILQARAALPEFLAVLENPPDGTVGISFKFPLEGYEHIWVSDVYRVDDTLYGLLSNNPAAPGWALGDGVAVPISDVTDWTYGDASGVAHGAYTVRVMLDRMSPEDAEATRRAYGW